MAEAEAMSASGMAQFRPGGQGTRQGHQQAGTTDKVQMEGEEAADDGDEEHAAAHPAQHGHDAEQEGDHQQNHRPGPPGHAARFGRNSHGALRRHRVRSQDHIRQHQRRQEQNHQEQR
jgi:hypothetical protein